MSTLVSIISLTNVTEMILNQLRQTQNDTSGGSRISQMGFGAKAHYRARVLLNTI